MLNMVVGAAQDAERGGGELTDLGDQAVAVVAAPALLEQIQDVPPPAAVEAAQGAEKGGAH